MTSLPHTNEAIVARINARKEDDFFGFETTDYIRCLDFDGAKPFLKDGVTKEEWDGPLTVEAVKEEMTKYADFAWEKANNNRGLSANRSISHFIAWTWLVGDVALSEAIEKQYNDDYCYYGKPILVGISEYYGWDWKAKDDGRWTNDEMGDGTTADHALSLHPTDWVPKKTEEVA